MEKADKDRTISDLNSQLIEQDTKNAHLLSLKDGEINDLNSDILELKNVNNSLI